MNYPATCPTQLSYAGFESQLRLYYSWGWNTEHVRYPNGSPLFSFPMAFCFGQNGGHLVQNQLKSKQNFKTLGIPMCLVFQCLLFKPTLDQIRQNKCFNLNNSYPNKSRSSYVFYIFFCLFYSGDLNTRNIKKTGLFVLLNVF